MTKTIKHFCLKIKTKTKSKMPAKLTLVRCMRPYNEYRKFTPNPEGAPAAMQRCWITASRRTANAMSCALENKAPRQ